MNNYPIILNIVLYQIVWFGCVFWQDKFILPGTILLGLHLLLCKNKVQELAVVLYCASMGLMMDAILTLFGFFEFSATPSFLPIPLWLVLIWVGFAGTLRHGLRYFMDRPLLALSVAAVGAPLVYHSASRLGAVTFPIGPVVTGLVISAAWLFLMVMFLLVTQLLSNNARPV